LRVEEIVQESVHGATRVKRSKGLSRELLRELSWELPGGD
jgi:hypothetical protein